MLKAETTKKQVFTRLEVGELAEQQRVDTESASQSLKEAIPIFLGLRPEDRRQESPADIAAAAAAAVTADALPLMVSASEVGKKAAYKVIDEYPGLGTVAERTKLKRFGTNANWAKMRNGGLTKDFKGNPTGAQYRAYLAARSAYKTEEEKRNQVNRMKREEKRQEQLEAQRVLGAEVYDAMVAQHWTVAAVEKLSVPKALALLVVKAPNNKPSSSKRVDVFSALHAYVLLQRSDLPRSSRFDEEDLKAF